MEWNALPVETAGEREDWNADLGAVTGTRGEATGSGIASFPRTATGAPSLKRTSKCVSSRILRRAVRAGGIPDASKSDELPVLQSTGDAAVPAPTPGDPARGAWGVAKGGCAFDTTVPGSFLGETNPKIDCWSFGCSFGTPLGVARGVGAETRSVIGSFRGVGVFVTSLGWLNLATSSGRYWLTSPTRTLRMFGFPAKKSKSRVV